MTKVALIDYFFNPCGYRTKYANYSRYKNALPVTIKPHHYTIELIFEGEQPEVPGAYKTIIGNKTKNIMWQKERLLNILIEELRFNYDVIAWLDCDIIFDDPHWIDNLKRRIESADFIQLFSEVVYLGPNSENFRIHVG